MIRYALRAIYSAPRRAYHGTARFLRGLNYEPQHVDPWGDPAVLIYNREPDTLDGFVLYPETGYRLGATRVYQPPAAAALPPAAAAGHHRSPYLALEILTQLAEAQAEEDERLLDDRWLRAGLRLYVQERRREAADYHVRIDAERRAWRRENGLSPLEAVAA